MKIGLTIGFTISLALAAPVFAQQVDQTRVDLFISLIADNGCSMTEDQAKNVLPESGFDRDESREIAGYLISNGQVTLNNGELTLVSGCETAADDQDATSAGLTEQQQQFITILATNNCTVTQPEMEEIFSAQGMDVYDAYTVVSELFASGIAQVSEDKMTVTVGSDYCASGDDSANVAEAPEADLDQSVPFEIVEPTPELLLAQILVQNGCSISELDARTVFPAAGLEMEQVYAIVEALQASGDIGISGDDTTITLVNGGCTPEVADPNTNATIPVETPVETLVVDPIMEPPSGVDPRIVFTTMLGENNCQLSQQDAAQVIADAGLDFNEMMQVATQMLNDGTATSPDGGNTLIVSSPDCVVAGSARPMTNRDIFVDLIRQNNCSITAGEFSTLLLVDGLDQNIAFGLIAELEADGIITLPPTRDVITLTAENCR